MDIFFHGLLPYFLGSYLRLERKQIAALVLGGIAPDLDVFLSWINQIYPTSILLVHRGITHSLFFGSFFALILLYLCTYEPIKGYLSRTIKFDLELSLTSIFLVFSGTLIHLAVDFTTTGGIPFFYPWQSLRYSAEVFFYLELGILIVSLLVLAVLAREKFRPVFNKNMFVLFLISLLIIGAIRLEGKQASQSYFDGMGLDIKVHPDFNLFSWTGVDSDTNQFTVYKYDMLSGNLSDEESYPKLHVASKLEEAKEAIATAEDLPQIKIFRWKANAVAINATSTENGSWDIEFYDPMVKMRMDRIGRFSWPRPAGYGSVRVVMTEGVQRVVG